MYISNNDEDNIYLSQNIEYVVVVGVVVVLYGIDSNAYLLTSSWKEKRKTNINWRINISNISFFIIKFCHE